MQLLERSRRPERLGGLERIGPDPERARRLRHAGFVVELIGLASTLPPQQGRFGLNFDAGSATVHMSGYTCTGLTGEWKVSLSVSGGGSGSGTTTFTPEPGDKGVPVTWSFAGQLDGSIGTWAGTVRVYIAGPPDAPRFQLGGTETFQTGSKISTGPAAGAAVVKLAAVPSCSG